MAEVAVDTMDYPKYGSEGSSSAQLQTSSINQAAMGDAVNEARNTSKEPSTARLVLILGGLWVRKFLCAQENCQLTRLQFGMLIVVMGISSPLISGSLN
jgi:hypothetical protein